MPKRRVPGHLNRRSRRRDDSRPNVPAPTPIEPAEIDGVRPDAPAAASIPGARPLRPTQRSGAANRFVRSAAPPPAAEVDYRPVMADLRQIGMWAAVAFVVLVALTFIIR
jgi:hypothetical protein